MGTFTGRAMSRTCRSVVAIVVGATSALALAPALTSTLPLHAQSSTALSALDLWIVQRYRGAQLLPDSGVRASSPVRQAGAPRIESARTTTRRDTVVALHFGPTYWRAALGPLAPVQLADPTGVVSSITGRVTARRAFRAPRVAGARDSANGEWRIGWAYLVAIPTRTANAASAGFNGWAVVEAPSKNLPTATKAPQSESLLRTTAPPASLVASPPIR